jgi:hypothetical protein
MIEKTCGQSAGSASLASACSRAQAMGQVGLVVDPAEVGGALRRPGEDGRPEANEALGRLVAVGLFKAAQPGADEIPQFGVLRGAAQGLEVAGLGRQLCTIGFFRHFAIS